MAAPSIAFTIGRVADMLGESEDLLHEIATDMDPEDGCLSVLGRGEEETVVFTPDGLERLRELVPDYKNRD